MDDLMRRNTVVTYEEAKEVAGRLRVNTEVVSVERLQVGMNVELEHGPRYSKTDITNGTADREVIAKIALVHFMENPGTNLFPDYYSHLQNMEWQSEAYWSEYKKRGGVPPNVFLPDPKSDRARTFFDVLHGSSDFRF